MSTVFTITNNSEYILVEQKSKFIGHCFHISSESEAYALLENNKKQFWDAKHNCFAFIVGETDQKEKCSDDGEPSGTAGIQILNVLKGIFLTDVLCIVTRYFGGILLGRGGLSRAYSDTAQRTIEKASVCEIRKAYQCVSVLSYPQWARLESVFRANCIQVNPEFSDIVRVFFQVDVELYDSLSLNLSQRTDGMLRSEILKECTYLAESETERRTADR